MLNKTNDYYIIPEGKLLKVYVSKDGALQLTDKYSIGNALIDFMYYDLLDFKNYTKKAIPILKKEQGKVLDKSLFAFIKTQNIYIKYFVSFFNKLICGYIKDKKNFRLFLKYFSREINLIKNDSNYSHSDNSILIALALIEHLRFYQEYLKKLFDCLFGNTKKETFSELTPMQTLYIFEKYTLNTSKNNIFIDTKPFTSRVLKNKAIAFNNVATVSKLADIMLKNDIEVNEYYLVKDIYALMRFEYMQILKNDVLVKLCKNCFRFFIPNGRNDIEYCSRLLPGQEASGKTCVSSGSMIKYKTRVKNDPIYLEYNKSYKRHSSRVQNGKLAKKDFALWAKEARRLRSECTKGNIDFNVYYNWLNKDRKYNIRTTKQPKT